MIESLNNEKVKYYKKLRDSKFIREENKFIVEGDHLVEEASKSGLLIEVLSCMDGYDYNVPNIIMSKACLKSISVLKSTPNVMGVVKLISKNDIVGKKIVILDNVQDPGNVGTIIRSGLAFNVSTLILSDNSVSIYNDKLIRSTEGAIFRLNIVRMNIVDALTKVNELGLDVYYADIDGKYELDGLKVKDYVLVLGSEGQGICEEVKKSSDKSIFIPINSLTESLNVAVAGAIIMYKFR